MWDLLQAVVATALIWVVVGMFSSAEGHEKVKYCKNYETGEIIVIEDGYPCPFPTSEI